MTTDPEKVALFDMDDTLVAYSATLGADLEKIRGPDEPPIPDIHGELPPHIETRIDLIRNSPGWWYRLPELELGMDVFKLARMFKFQNTVLSKGPFKVHQAWSQKYRWCRRHLGNDTKVMLVEDKGLVYGRVLVDDYPPYIERWLKWRPRGVVIMPAHEHNANFQHPQVIRYDGTNLGEVSDALMAAWRRGVREASC